VIWAKLRWAVPEVSGHAQVKRDLKLDVDLGKSRMRKRARTDLCGGRSAMVVPTTTVRELGQGMLLTVRQLAHLPASL
jgi:hypothetical protein